MNHLNLYLSFSTDYMSQLHQFKFGLPHTDHDRITKVVFFYSQLEFKEPLPIWFHGNKKWTVVDHLNPYFCFFYTFRILIAIVDI